MNPWNAQTRTILLLAWSACLGLLGMTELSWAADGPLRASNRPPIIRITNTQPQTQSSDRAHVGGVPVPSAELALPLAPVPPSTTPAPSPAAPAVVARPAKSELPTSQVSPSAPAPGPFTKLAEPPRIYKLSPGDRIEMKVFQQPDMTTLALISDDGTVNFPLLGAVKLGGLSEEQAKKLVRDLYEKDYFVNPEVSLNILERGKWKYTVTGQVNRPGPYEAMNGETLDLVEAISRAGDFNGKANKSDVRVTRRDGDRDLPPVSRDVDAMTRGREPRFEIKPGDKIHVKERLF